jgi:endonuclease/exonuclease/phosphatase family metal-dependent hydrolase
MFRLKIALAPITLVLLLALALVGCRGMAKRPDVTPEQPTLTVMTYNVYVGARTDALLASQDLELLPLGVAEMYNTVLVSDFPGRAAAIARIVKETQPHLIGLQEVSLLRTQTPGDVLHNPQSNAETVALDFLEVLLGALRAEGLSYTVAGQVENFDLEMPMVANIEEELVVDVRLTDYDVLLARVDVEIANPVAANYQLELALPHLGVTVPRGYVAVDATVEGTTYRVVNTHLESFNPAVRAAQAQELVASLSTEARPVILLGDFNTQAPSGDVYRFLLDDAGYMDVWQADSEGAGYTCCQAGDLRNAESALDQRIDLIFTRGVTLREGAAIRTATVGDRPADKARAGVWPSDHAGVVAHLPVE